MNPPFPLTTEYGVDLDPLAPPSLVSGGFSGAHVWKLHCQRGNFALRRWPESSDPHRLRSLHRILAHVKRDAVPVALPLRNTLGNTLSYHRDCWWQLEPWLPGSADFHTSPTDNKLAAAMHTLARFHLAAMSFEPTLDDALLFGGPSFGPAPTVLDRCALALRRLIGGEVNMLRELIPRSGGTSFDTLARRSLLVIDRIGHHVFDELRAAESLQVPLLPCLRDLWHDHVLFTGDNVTGLIDPAACRRDTVAADLSRLLGSLLGDNPPRWACALTCYEQLRSLTPNERSLIPILDRSGTLLSSINWLRRHYLAGENCNTPAITSRLSQLISRAEAINRSSP